MTRATHHHHPGYAGPRRGWRSVVVLAAALLLGGAACGGPPPAPAPPGMPPLAAPWPQRPVVDLAFNVAPDLRSVTGRERVVFTPDLPTCELVFRGWANKPTAAATGTAMTLTDTTVGGQPTAARVEPGGAPPGAPGTLIEVPLPRCLAPGESVTAELGFELRLGADADERLGMSPATRTAWFGSGFPLLAWVRGQGWARDPAVDIPGESTVSEDFRLASLAVTAPAGDAVAGTGTPAGQTPGPGPGTTTHRYRADAVRDVAVSVGHYQVLDRDVAAGDGPSAHPIRLHLFTPTAGTRVDAATWTRELDEQITALTALLGPFPYPDLWVSIVPAQSDGTEYPAALQFGDVRPNPLRALITHELAHQWFYSLVGNNQARDPWLDEALATYAETIGSRTQPDYQLDDIPDRVSGQMGAPMTSWESRGFAAYNQGVYVQGAAVLLEARRRAGPDRFDPALRAYIAANAHRIATPTDFARAMAELPQATGLLTRYGALSPTAPGRGPPNR